MQQILASAVGKRNSHSKQKQKQANTKPKERSKLITVFSKAHCPQCEATYNWLRKNLEDWEWESKPIDEKVMKFAANQGYTSAPIVVFDEEGLSHCGFNQDKLKEYREIIQSGKS